MRDHHTDDGTEHRVTGPGCRSRSWMFQVRVLLVLGVLAGMLAACGTDHAAIQARLVGTWRSPAARTANRPSWGWTFFADGTFQRTLASADGNSILSLRGTYTVRDTQTLTLHFEDLGTGGGTPVNTLSGAETTTFQVISDTLTITETYRGGAGPIAYHRVE